MPDVASFDESPDERDQRRCERADEARPNVSLTPGQAETLTKSAACPNCGHALAKTNRGWWWCSRCERRMRLKDSVGGSALLTSGAARQASLTPTDSAAKIVPPKRDPRTGEPLTTGTPSAAQSHERSKTMRSFTWWDTRRHRIRWTVYIGQAGSGRHGHRLRIDRLA